MLAMNNNSSTTNFKVELNQDNRRFAFEGNSFSSLSSTLKNIYGLSDNTPVCIKYKDDEGDMVTISSDLELMEAIKSSKNLVRLSLTVGTNAPVTASKEVVPVAVDAPTNQPPPLLSPATSLPPISASAVSSFPHQAPPLSSVTSATAAFSHLTMEDSYCKTPKQKRQEAIKALKQQWKAEKQRLKSNCDERDHNLKQKLQEMKGQMQSLRKQLKEQRLENRRFPKEGIMIARFVKDLSVPDNSEFPPGERFTKSWRFRNESQKSWPEKTQLLFIGKNSDRMSAPESVPISAAVAPKQEIDISVPLIAPAEPGRYTAFFRMADANGKKFGQRVWVIIRVVAHGSDSSSEGSAKSPAKFPKHPLNESDLKTFATQLESLHSMGFQNDHLNIRLLRKFNGNIGDVVNRLIQKCKKCPAKC
jgi:hypothetical protein